MLKYFSMNPRESFPGKSNHYELTPEQEDVQRTSNLFQAIEKTVTNPDIRSTIKDPVELAMLEASLPEFLEPGGRLRPHIDQVFAIERRKGRYLPNHYAFRKYELAIDNQMARIFGDYYPTEFTSSSAWEQHDAFGKFDYYQFFEDMQRNQAYNYPQAYEIFHIQTQLFQARGTPPPVVLNVGYAGGQADIKWALCKEYPFKKIKMGKFPEFNEPIGPYINPDLAAQEAVDRLTPNGPAISALVAIDILPIAPDNASQEWAINNTFPMSQKNRSSAEYQEFEAIQREVSSKENIERLRLQHNIHLDKHMIDASDAESMEILNDVLPGGKADFIIISGVLMQMPQEKIAQVLRNIQPYSNETAVVSVSEWAVADAKQPSGLKPISQNWWHRPGGFANFLFNPHKPGQPPVHMGSFMNRKGEEMLLTNIGRKLITGEETLESINF